LPASVPNRSRPQHIVTRGQGKPGFCKICVFPGAQFLNARYERDGKDAFNAARALEFAKTLDPTFTFTRSTWYEHVKHITHPLVTAADAARNSPVVVPKTTIGGLEMVRDVALARAAEHPEEITIDHGLKAMAELNKKQAGTDNVLIVFAKVLSGEQPAEAIVGEWHEVGSADQQEDPIHGS
jgi:hypothetical protein